MLAWEMVLFVGFNLPAEEEDLAEVGGSWSLPIGGVRVEFERSSDV